MVKQVYWIITSSDNGLGLTRPQTIIWSKTCANCLKHTSVKSWQKKLFLENAFNTLRPFPNDVFESICWKEYVWIPIKISLKFVPKSPINNITALVQIMAWRWPGIKPLSEPMLFIRLPTHICVTRPQRVNKVCNVLVILSGPQCFRFKKKKESICVHISW